MLTLFKVVKCHQNTAQVLNLFFEIVDDSVYESKIMNNHCSIVCESALITFSVYLLISTVIYFSCCVINNTSSHHFCCINLVTDNTSVHQSHHVTLAVKITPIHFLLIIFSSDLNSHQHRISVPVCAVSLKLAVFNSLAITTGFNCLYELVEELCQNIKNLHSDLNNAHQLIADLRVASHQFIISITQLLSLVDANHQIFNILQTDMWSLLKLYINDVTVNNEEEVVSHELSVQKIDFSYAEKKNNELIKHHWFLFLLSELSPTLCQCLYNSCS